MTALSINTTPPPYEHYEHHDPFGEHEDKPLLPSSPYPSPTSTAASDVPTPKAKVITHSHEHAQSAKVIDHGADFEKVGVVHCAEGDHDTALAPRQRAIRVGITMANPCLGLMIALCPKGRRRVCRACGAVVTVSKKRAFC